MANTETKKSDSKFNPKVIIIKFIMYILGLSLIAIGINISKLSRLGISPVSSIPRAVESIWGGPDSWITLGIATWFVYAVIVIIQICVQQKKFKLYYLLELPLTIVFGWFVDFFGVNEKTFGHLLSGLPSPTHYLMKLIYLAISMVVIAIGVYLYISPKWISMPCESLAGAISDKTGMKFGNCKTIIDCSLILIALILQLVFMGGFASFTSENVVVREGTILSAYCIGQLVKLLSKLLGPKMSKLLGKK